MRCILPSRAFHEVWCPDASRAGMQGSGTSKTSLDGKVDSPHYGGYTTHAVVNASSASPSDCCCCGCCRLTHFPNYLLHFSKLSREAAVAALRRWRRRLMPDPSMRSPRQILCTVTTFGNRRAAAAPNPLCLSVYSHNFENDRFRVRQAYGSSQ